MADQDQQIRSFSLYIEGALWGTLQGNAYDVTTGSELQIGDGVVIGVSQGVPVVKLVANGIVPVAGHPVAQKIEQLALAHKLIKIGAGILNGRIHKLNMYCTAFSYKGDNPKGTCMGDWTFEGGKPTFVG
jgi:hypothetical protein